MILALTDNIYKIFPQPDLPEVDMDNHMQNWITFCEEELNHTFKPTDYIFPLLSPNGKLDWSSPMSHDYFQKLIDQFATKANILDGNISLTIHCFRRGGAQYRFQYAPIGQRWTLAMIRWWGSWSEGEPVRYMTCSSLLYVCLTSIFFWVFFPQ